MNTQNLAFSSTVTAQLNLVVLNYGITSPLRLAHFLSQVAHESGEFKFTTENLNYSADGLLKTFPKYFNTTNVNDYARNPEKIASRVYASRMGNGDEASKEGFKFRGRGYLQVTGKENYQKFSTFIGEDCVANPDLLATKYPMDSAIWFFDRNKLWDICEKGATTEDVKAVTKKVNGGYHGLDDRQKKFDQYYKALK